jgi:hypothetical protein
MFSVKLIFQPNDFVLVNVLKQLHKELFYFGGMLCNPFHSQIKEQLSRMLNEIDEKTIKTVPNKPVKIRGS